MNYSEKLKDPRWQKKRLEILQRDDFACVECGNKEKTLHIHHIAYNDGDPWDIDNKLLMTLCKMCHETEQIWLSKSIKVMIKILKKNGFTSNSFIALGQIFNTDRGWTYYDDALNILKMAIENDKIWGMLQETYIRKQIQNGKTRTK